jgi:glycosyltransferase involved in cell wall biosynthesis
MSKTKSKPGLVSVVVPVFNERDTIVHVIANIKKRSGLKSYELVVVDDGSSDGTGQVLSKHKSTIHTLIRRKENGGKGAAIKDGVAAASGEFLIIQDADLEYDPADYAELLAPLQAGLADVVYGSRFVGSKPHRVVYFWHYVANNCLTLLTNLLSNVNLTDMETGYKACRSSFIKNIQITERGFGIEPELTTKFAASPARMYEVGISYHGRTYEEGKKIGFPDALRAVYVLFKWTFLIRWTGLKTWNS